MLRWLEPENGQPPKKWLPDEKLRQQIRAIVEKVHTMNRLQNFAVSRTAGIRRIKRSKIILGFLAGLGIEKLVTKVRVPPESIVKCLNRFAQKGLQYFDHSITLDNDSVWPSTPMAWPEMPTPMSDAKKITIFAISSAVTNRRREVWHS